MKRLLWVWLMLLLLLSLSACGGKLADGMQVEIAEGSSGYSTEDIQAAVDVVEKKFKRDFSGCTMTAGKRGTKRGPSSMTQRKQWFSTLILM